MYLTIIRTPYDPENEGSGYLRVAHVPVPRPKMTKGGGANNDRIRQKTFSAFVDAELIANCHLAASHRRAIVDWFMAAGMADTLNLPPYGGCDAAVLILHDEGEPTNYVVREEPAFVLGSETDELEDLLNEDEEDDEPEDEEDERPMKKSPKKKPR